jgi:hypothetical protein
MKEKVHRQAMMKKVTSGRYRVVEYGRRPGQKLHAFIHKKQPYSKPVFLMENQTKA